MVGVLVLTPDDLVMVIGCKKVRRVQAGGRLRGPPTWRRRHCMTNKKNTHFGPLFTQTSIQLSKRMLAVCSYSYNSILSQSIQILATNNSLTDTDTTYTHKKKLKAQISKWEKEIYYRTAICTYNTTSTRSDDYNIILYILSTLGLHYGSTSIT